MKLGRLNRRWRPLASGSGGYVWAGQELRSQQAPAFSRPLDFAVQSFDPLKAGRIVFLEAEQKTQPMGCIP